MDSNKRNIIADEIIHYEGYLYGYDLLEEELVHITVSKQNTEDTIWSTSVTPSSNTVKYFENTAWTFSFQIDTSESNYTTDVTYVVKAIYDDKSTNLNFFINSNKLEEKATDAGNAIVIAGEKTGEMIVESGTQVGEFVTEKGTETSEMIVEKGSEVTEKGEMIGEVVIEKSSEGIQEINEKGGGGCLIATAAYGSELAPQVQFLREIRDNTVMSTESGASFMTGFNQLYYVFSPTIADMQRENPMFQQVVRAFITPMISTLSIMTLAEDGSEGQVLGLGLSVIALNLGMYVAAPATMGFAVNRYIHR